MNIFFATDDLRQLCNEDRTAKKKLGADGAKKLRRRLDDMRAAATLSVMKTLPGRCHQLHYDLKGRLAVDLDGGRRIVFRPEHDPVPELADGGLDWAKVTAITIESVEDYHD